MDVKLIVALVLGGMGVLLDIIGLALPYWRYQKSLTQGIKMGTSKVGLWKYCISQISPECSSLSDRGLIGLTLETDSLKATRAMVILGMLLGVGALTCFLLRLFLMKDKAILNKVAAGLAIAAGVLMVLGAIIYATDKGPELPSGDHVHVYDNFDLHAGFALVIVAAIIEGAGGIVMFIAPTDD